MYYRMLSQLKNAGIAGKDTVVIAQSKMNLAVARILAQAGYLKDVQKKITDDKPVLELRVSYHNKKPVLSDFRIVSKPSRRIYSGYRDMKPVRNNFGLGVISTPSGIMTAKEARKQKVGGEYLFQVW